MTQTSSQLAHPKTVVIAVHHFPPTFKGGAEWRAHRTAHWLQQAGYRVYVIAVESIDSPQPFHWTDEIEDGLPVRRLHLNLIKAPRQWEYDHPELVEHFKTFFDEVKPDIVHLISGYLMTVAPLTVAQQHNIPTIVTLTDYWFLCPRHTLQNTQDEVCEQNTPLDCARCHYEEKRIFHFSGKYFPQPVKWAWALSERLPVVAEYEAHIERRAERLKTVLAQVDVAIAPSKFLRDTYLQRGLQAKQMVHLQQGLKHLPQDAPAKTPAQRLRIGSIGSLNENKGVHLLVKAVHSLKSENIELKIYGDPKRNPRYVQQLKKIANADPRITFMGAFDNAQIGQVHAELDLLAVPSTWYENSPNVILEAFAYQTPCVVSDLGGMAELIQHEVTGLRFRPNSANDLAASLQKILDQPELLATWRNNIQPPKSLAVEMVKLEQHYQTLLRPSEDTV